MFVRSENHNVKGDLPVGVHSLPGLLPGLLWVNSHALLSVAPGAAVLGVHAQEEALCP